MNKVRFSPIVPTMINIIIEQIIKASDNEDYEAVKRLTDELMKGVA